MKSNEQAPTPKEWRASNYYQIITNIFIKQFHQGVIPWRYGTHVPFHDFAQNYHSAHIYQGINWLQLNLVKAQENPYYLTWYQTQQLGGSVLKGTKSETIFYFNTYYKNQEGKKIPKVRAKHLQEQGAEVQKISYLKAHKVFNLKSIKDIDWNLTQKYRWKQLDTLLKAIKDKHKIEYDNITQSCCAPTTDTIILASSTDEEEHWYPYLLFVHLIHWTGQESRLGRDGIMNNALDCGYDIEEQLVADIGASMLSRLVGIELESTIEKGEEEVLTFWIQALEENNRFIFRVAARAQQAIQYLLSY